MLVLLYIFKQKNCSTVYIFSFAIFWIYLMILVSLTLFPIPIIRSPDWRVPVSSILARINFTPFRYGVFFNFSSLIIFREIVGNILLTVPFGMGIQYITRIKPQIALWAVLAVGLAIELTQLTISIVIGIRYRTVDVTDVILNTIGSLIGFIIFLILSLILKSLAKSKK